MSTEFQITSFHLDVLKEIGNIGSAHAATSLSQLLNRKVSMYVPNVQLVTFDEMFDLAGGADQIIVSVFLRIQGDVSGSMFFISSIDCANYFNNLLTGDGPLDFHMMNTSDIGFSSIQELGNILSGSYLSALSDFTGLKIIPTVPSLTVDMAGAVISLGLLEVSQYCDEVIVIDTVIQEEGIEFTDGVKGNFFLIPDPDSYETLFQSLGVR